MKKKIIVITAALIISITLSKVITEATLAADPDVKYQTWEEFLESGVKIEYDEPSETIDDPATMP